MYKYMVSILIAAYNVSQYIERCLKSLEVQTFKDFEVIIVNDCSTDTTKDVIANYLNKSNLRAVVIDLDENQGPSFGRHTALAKARGDYFYCIDGDDWIEPDAIEKFYNKAIEQNYDMVACDFYIDTGQSKNPVEFKKDLLYRQLKEAILSGKYPPGSRFPCEVDFASQLGVAFVTLRSALKRLEDDGLITRLRSRGTFVNELSSSAGAEKNSRRKILLLFRGKVHLESMEANVFNRQLAFGVFSQSAFHGMSADLKIIPLDMPWEKQVLYAENNGYSAMILDRYSQELQDQIVRRKTALPLVLVNREVDGIPSVCCNYVSAIRMAIQHLRELGHRQILLLDHGNETARVC